MQHAAFFDVDGTLTTGRVWRGLMRYFTEIHPRPWTNRWFWAQQLPAWGLFKLKLRGSVRFRHDWARDLGQYLQGLSVAEVQAASEWVVREHVQLMLRTDVTAILARHLAEGDVVVLVSSGPQPLLMEVGAALGVQHVVATPFEVREGRYTGRTAGPVCIGRYKASLAQSYLAQQGLKIDYLSSYAYADSASDIELLELVGQPVAVYPDDSLVPLLQQRGWPAFPVQTPPETLQP